MNKKRFHIGNLPEPLLKKVSMYALIAVAVILVSIAFSVAEHDPRYLTIMVVSLYFMFLAVSTVYRWNAGKIREIAAYCASVTVSPVLKSNCTVLFTLDDPKQPTLTISVPVKGCPYISNISYVLYIDEGNTGQVLASYPVS